MAKSRLFDNIVQVLATNNIVASTTTVSSELDFELPRGYVAKIHKIIVTWDDVFDKCADAEKDEQKWAVMLDPDDATTVQMPTDTVEHDCIAAGRFEIAVLAAAYMGMYDEHRVEIDFSHLEGLDVLTARNMRFNSVGGAASFDASVMQCQIYYTLEAIQDKQIMELLDIL